jgi:predicted metal-dependent hydrolase
MSVASAARRHPGIRPRRVQTRRIQFDYPAGQMPRYYMGGDPVMSHAVALLSALFPEGEDFFVRSVRAFRDRIEEPELKKQVAGFIGQEAMHGREHRNFNRRLQAMGYQTWLVDRLTKVGLGVAARTLPKDAQLAITAALEHYTATLAEVLLGQPEARELLDTEEIRSMLLWHALEESEHKAVAFDVYQAVSGKRWLRVVVMDAVTLGFVALVFLGTTAGLLIDWRTYRYPRQTPRSLRRLRTSPFLQPDVVRRIRAYNRKGFHPDDYNATALVEEWSANLFGDGGPLADRFMGVGGVRN